jgi:putative phosphoribosyl transferase
MFVDRRSAGAQLAARLSGEQNAVVLGIARGGVIVAEPIAARLAVALDVIVIRKVGHPLQPELALGAVSADGDVILTDYAASFSDADLRTWVDATIQRAKELEARLRAGVTAVPVIGKAAIVVDDGIATSATMLCAIATARRRGAVRIVAAVPVAPEESIPTLRTQCDLLVVLEAITHPHFAVGRFYVNFFEVSDDEVRLALERSRR